MAAVMVGIVVNALSLQHERHPSPFFSAAVAPPSAVAKPPAVAASTSTAITAVAPAEPPARPAALGGATEQAPSSHVSDPIGAILRSGASKDSQHWITAAQTALVKLGYTVKVTGAPGPETTTALRDFEKNHGLPLSSEVSAHLVKLLAAAANTSASR
jgi:peptidoglycan hydrolase-like protein with peptidoglycan-binding domain